MKNKKKKRLKKTVKAVLLVICLALLVCIVLAVGNLYKSTLPPVSQEQDVHSGDEQPENELPTPDETNELDETDENENIPPVALPTYSETLDIPETQVPEEPKPEEKPAEKPEVNTSDPAANIPVTADSEWNLILVNPWNKLPEDFEVKLTQLKNGHSVDERAYPDLQQMMDDARAEGLSPLICSSFRTQNKQTTLFTNQVNSYLNQGYSNENAVIEAGKWVAVPGTSEHQTGLAVDIVAVSYQVLDQKQEETAEQKWLMENSYKYGWILRYPSDKSELTGIYYEPWHYRYVGKEAAKEIFEKGICLEEYLATLV